jgi:TRAP-type mannitol/chloroaromatic compound transport system substrate-binding protein
VVGLTKKIRSANDLKGLKMRMPGLGGQVLGKLGGSPISLPAQYCSQGGC